MAVRTILRLGDPRLREPARPVTDLDTPELDALVADMLDTMRAHDGAGLAAIQIGVPLRVVIFGGQPSPRYPDAADVPFTILLDPQIEPLGVEREDGWEGCLSVPGLRGLVPRFTRIRYRGRDERGAPIDRTVEGFHARVVQHECDHLDGILYTDRIENRAAFGFIEELQASALISASVPAPLASATAAGPALDRPALAPAPDDCANASTRL
jgi:peptide deformylase